MPTIKSRAKDKNGKPYKRGPKRLNRLDREHFLEEVGMYYRQGFRMTEIATMLDCSVSQISQDIKKLRDRQIQEQEIADKRVMVQDQLEKLRDVRREAWKAWELSKENSSKVVEEEGIPKRKDSEDVGTIDVSMELIRRIKTREGRLPANCYLSTILETFKAERELLGLDEESSTPTTVNVIDWRQMARPIADAIDPVENKIRALEDGTCSPMTQPTPSGQENIGTNSDSVPCS